MKDAYRRGRYRISGRIAKGGYAYIYRGRDTQGGADVALKVMRGEAFRLESRIPGPHPGVVSVKRFYDRPKVIVFELVEGGTLKSVLRWNRILPEGIAAAIVSEVCGALAFSHAKKIFHLDVKLEHILLTPGGAVKICDFGNAALYEVHTARNAPYVVGSMNYMSPEQLQGEKLDGRSDVFSLGVVLYILLTGKKPYNGREKEEQINLIRAGIQSFPELPMPVSESFKKIVFRAIAWDRKNRYSSIDLLRDELIREGGFDRHDGAAAAIKRFCGNIPREYLSVSEDRLNGEDRRLLQSLEFDERSAWEPPKPEPPLPVRVSVKPGLPRPPVPRSGGPAPPGARGSRPSSGPSVEPDRKSSPVLPDGSDPDSR
jgi:serine/threonine protein kinase